jgi:tetratricopeptide (TPR) repeat protein
LYGKAVEADPTLAQAYWERGRLRLGRGQAEAARQDLDRWLAWDPRYALVRADHDLLLFSNRRETLQREEEEAGRDAETEGSPLAAFRHYAEAYALSAAGDEEDRLAGELIRAWKACSPRPAYPPALKTFLARGQFFAGEGSHEEAAAAYHQAARFCPWCAEAHFNEAVILGEYQRYPEAIRALRRAMTLLPEGPDAQEAEGMLLTWEMLGP